MQSSLVRPSPIGDILPRLVVATTHSTETTKEEKWKTDLQLPISERKEPFGLTAMTGLSYLVMFSGELSKNFT